MTQGIAEFANVDDPLDLGTEVQCIDEGGLGGGELDMSDLKNSTGGFKQGNARAMKDEGTVRYNPNGDMTVSGGTATIESAAVVAVGETKQGYFILSVKHGSDNENHKTLDVTCRKHVNVDKVDQAVS
ncbi:MAG: hypothetical protein HON70_06375 [Lentisphaerae bacterium]|jgi:hypothetical protein|nr:hypothetical protein [Lentisphaerota bacterium]